MSDFDIILSGDGIMLGMSEKVWLTIIKAVSTTVAMVLVWRLVTTALQAGIDGVMFFGGVAAIAGLGGYEVRWIIDAVRSRSSANKK
ncbi:hypothetical protein ES705_24639 [subsurface metagenome]